MSCIVPGTWRYEKTAYRSIRLELFAFKKAKCEAAAQRRAAESERKTAFFSAKRQAVWFETRSVSN